MFITCRRLNADEQINWQDPVILVPRAPSATMHDGSCSASGTAQTSPLDLKGNIIKAEETATQKMSTEQLVWKPPEPGVTDAEWLSSCGWKGGETPVTRCTLFKRNQSVCNGTVQLLPGMQLLLCSKDLKSFENVTFSGVMFPLWSSDKLHD
jgi:hypothetical protein